MKVVAKHAIATGCGIDALDVNGLQLRQGPWVHKEFAKKKHGARSSQNVAAVVLMASVVSGAVGLLYSHKKGAIIRQS